MSPKLQWITKMWSIRTLCPREPGSPSNFHFHLLPPLATGPIWNSLELSQLQPPPRFNGVQQEVRLSLFVHPSYRPMYLRKGHGIHEKNTLGSLYRSRAVHLPILPLARTFNLRRSWPDFFFHVLRGSFVWLSSCFSVSAFAFQLCIHRAVHHPSEWMNSEGRKENNGADRVIFLDIYTPSRLLLFRRYALLFIILLSCTDSCVGVLLDHQFSRLCTDLYTLWDTTLLQQ